MIMIDAMDTPIDIAHQIINQEADYILALKGNQSTLHDQVQEGLLDVN
jgi:predicted transposase YbfD/YdcC